MKNYTDDSKLHIGNAQVIAFCFIWGASLISAIPLFLELYLPLFCAGFSFLTVSAMGLELRRRSHRRLVLEKLLKRPSYIKKK
ncbi:MAG: hypothetical protein Q8T09_11205 [Candidatus Melainabacteria bacterium]|nr:hypothetical protein [Candidatus Melainabacteria bacterium]